MKRSAVISMCLAGVFASVTSLAIDLKQSKVTQVVNDVQIISAADQKQKAAAVNDLFSMPDVLRTGAASRAELVAQDATVTRVGANTIFSFDPANRTLDLQQGSLLFHAAHGKGGGTIHTGSATASVLGTTLIVTTTPNGGFKVLDLEGRVEMKLRDGRKQKLEAGQMTFVLPGTNQLAPVVIFRIDELIQNSLLIKGFTETLESLPLIQNQSALQFKALQSGKLSDTGLYAGNNASPNQVEVLDRNTVSHGQQVNPQANTPPPPITPNPPPPITPNPPPPNPGAAEAADATINHSSLTDPSIPTPPNHVFTGISLSLPQFNFEDRGFSGFLARNIFMNTLGTASGDGAGPLLVNLHRYAGVTTFNFLAVNNFSIEGSVNFQGLSPGNYLTLFAGNQFSFTPGVSVSTDVQTFWLSSPGSLSLDNVSLGNLGQDVNLYSSSGAISLQDNSQVNAGGLLNLNAAGNVSVASSQLNGGSAVFDSLTGTIEFDSSTLNVKNNSSLIASTAINLNNSTITSDSVSLIGTGNTPITINNTTINASSSLTTFAAGDLDITGNTVSPGDRRRSHFDRRLGLEYRRRCRQAVAVHRVPGQSMSAAPPSRRIISPLNSGDGILLDANGQTVTASGSGATANFTAPNLITVNNANFSSFAVVNMAANTIVLANDVLGVINNFGTATGLANFGGSVIPGELNLFSCTWQGNPVTSASVTYSSGPLNTPGIYSYKH